MEDQWLSCPSVRRRRGRPLALFCNRPEPPPKGKEIEVLTDELAFMLALSLVATLKTEVEVFYDESHVLSSVRMLDR